jgi:hypothetical protein
MPVVTLNGGEPTKGRTAIFIATPTPITAFMSQHLRIVKTTAGTCYHWKVKGTTSPFGETARRRSLQ